MKTELQFMSMENGKLKQVYKSEYQNKKNKNKKRKRENGEGKEKGEEEKKEIHNREKRRPCGRQGTDQRKYDEVCSKMALVQGLLSSGPSPLPDRAITSPVVLKKIAFRN